MIARDYVLRTGFCLGCGHDIGLIKVWRESPWAPVADAPHPGWCQQDACRANRATFTVVADRIIRED